jgi:hypothetical protein
MDSGNANPTSTDTTMISTFNANLYRFYHTNEHTDIVMLTNASGQIVNQYKMEK